MSVIRIRQTSRASPDTISWWQGRNIVYFHSHDSGKWCPKQDDAVRQQCDLPCTILLPNACVLPYPSGMALFWSQTDQSDWLGPTGRKTNPLTPIQRSQKSYDVPQVGIPLLPLTILGIPLNCTKGGCHVMSYFRYALHFRSCFSGVSLGKIYSSFEQKSQCSPLHSILSLFHSCWFFLMDLCYRKDTVDRTL